MSARHLGALLTLLLAVSPIGAQEHVSYLAFGDSVTEGVGDDAGSGGYPSRLEDRFLEVGETVDVENQGLGGENTAEGLARLTGLLSSTLATIVLLMEGTNDISDRISQETTLFNLKEMVDRSEDAGLETVLATIVPRLPGTSADPLNVHTDSLSAELRRDAFSTGQELADPNNIFLIQGSTIRDFYSTDLHPNAQGYDLLASIFFDLLRGRDTEPPAEGHLTPDYWSVRVDPDTRVTMEVFDLGEGLDRSTLRIVIDGEPVSTDVSEGLHRVVLTYEGGSLPENARVEFGLQGSDLAFPPNSVDRVVTRFDTGESTASPLVGDIDEDGRVDGDDLVILALAFGASKGEKRYLKAADLDRDDTIDGQDLALLASNFGQSS